MECETKENVGFLLYFIYEDAMSTTKKYLPACHAETPGVECVFRKNMMMVEQVYEVR